ncbi:glycoside hydrolase family 3 C-terminal domain-containing protein [Clavibacter sp. CFBP 8614]|uniref:glycoside hydrolase family 3 C-terminal domain-containing protein n=1 Tax=unclassified Clavibacter TaxID=2626594 RepID=UPI00404178FC
MRRRTTPGRTACLGLMAAVSATTLGLAPQASAGTAASSDPAGLRSPAIAANAPHTRTVDWLVSRMTPTEELDLMEGSWADKTNIDGTLDPDTHDQAGYVRGVARLGIPETRHADALGIEASAAATSYPNRLGLASSFDRDAFSRFGQRVGEDGAEMDMDLIYGPQVDIVRMPSWKRDMTALSEDPYVASELGSREIQGIQSTGLLAQVKHVSSYDGQDQNIASLVEGQAAHELYLAPIEAAASAGVSSMMCSYATSRIVGEEDEPRYACANSGLLQRIVKDEWGFPGWITTDYGGGTATSDLLAGTDQEFTTTNFSSDALLPLIDPQSDSYDERYAHAARESVSRILYQYERFGLLDDSRIPEAVRSPVPQHGDVDDTDHAIRIDEQAGIEESLQLAEESAVLLKDDGGALPLDPQRSVAVMGQSATLLPAGPGGERALGFGDRTNITPLKAMRSIAGDRVTSAPGIDLLGTTVPADALSADEGGTTRGLTRTTTTGTVSTTSTDAAIDGDQTDLRPGSTYSWTGYLDVPADGQYRLLTQRPYGTDSGDDSRYNQDTRPASNSTATLAVDGRSVALTDPDAKVLPNAYPTYSTEAGIRTTAGNGQYLGYENAATVLDLTAGRHRVTLGYAPSAIAATTPTFRFAWSPIEDSLRQAETAARTHDVSAVFVDDANQVTGDGVSPTSDVARLSADQDALIRRVTAAAHGAGHRVVVVVNSDAAVQMPWEEGVDAVLEMWYPGQEGGAATADTLYGVSDPSGKLTISFPRNSSETLFAGHPERAGGTQPQGEPTRTIKWTEGLDVGYRWYASAENTQGFAPMFAFGHGLSYTHYVYDDYSARATGDGGIDVDLRITDAGGVAGSEIPQVYVGPSSELPDGIAQAPTKLVQFDRVDLAAGQSKRVRMHVTARELSSWSESSQRWVLGTGPRTVSVGAASDDIRVSSTVDVAAADVAAADAGGRAALVPSSSTAPAVAVPAVPSLAEPEALGPPATSRARRGGAGRGHRRR